MYLSSDGDDDNDDDDDDKSLAAGNFSSNSFDVTVMTQEIPPTPQY